MSTESGPRTLEVPVVAGPTSNTIGGSKLDEVPSIVDEVPVVLHRISPDEVFSALGSLVGSFCLVWLLYYDILPFGGVVGFVVCWYFGFLAMYAGVSSLTNPRPVVVDRVIGAVIVGVALLVGFTLVTVVVYTLWRGHQVLLHWNFYSQPASAGSLSGPYNKGGISNVILGSIIQIGIAVCISLPLGLGTAIFMTEVGGWFSKIVRTVVEAMTAVPDLLAGLFVYVTLILTFHGHRNGLAVAIAISVTMTPIVARSAEVALRVVPGGLREAGQALGASHWSTVKRIVLPTAAPGLATALILAVARGIGESAPLLIVSGFTTFANYNPVDDQTMNSLPLYIYETIRSGQPSEIARGFGAATVLLFMVFLLFAVTRFLARQRPGRG
jgi:phosphate transport system permease protein